MADVEAGKGSMSLLSIKVDRLTRALSELWQKSLMYWDGGQGPAFVSVTQVPFNNDSPAWAG